MIGAFDERQPGDDFRRGGKFERRPPGSGAGNGEGGNEAEIAFRFGHRLDHARRAHMRHERRGEAEMEARGIAHRGVAGGEIGMHRERRLHVGEGRNDDAPDALDGVERQVAVMAFDQTAHHLGLAGGPEGGAGLLRFLHRDQGVDGFAALHQQRMHGRVDAVELAPQIGERNFLLAGRFGMSAPGCAAKATSAWRRPGNGLN